MQHGDKVDINLAPAAKDAPAKATHLHYVVYSNVHTNCSRDLRPSLIWLSKQLRHIASHWKDTSDSVFGIIFDLSRSREARTIIWLFSCVDIKANLCANIKFAYAYKAGDVLGGASLNNNADRYGVDIFPIQIGLGAVFLVV